MPELSSRHRKDLELALTKYDRSWDEAIGRIHPTLIRSESVPSKDLWLGRRDPLGNWVQGIIDWKSARARGWARWSDAVPRITRAAFKLADSDHLAGAVELLDELPGVAVRMATAILMFYDPARFTVMDVRAWRSLIHLGRASPFDFWFESSMDYPKYNAAVLSLSADFGHSLRNTDRALWILDESKGHPENYE